jgi:poly-gamma-glutamate capsule biosynthesis protein CapA/YwtB (metallophosphatase superfamily)
MLPKNTKTITLLSSSFLLFSSFCYIVVNAQTPNGGQKPIILSSALPKIGDLVKDSVTEITLSFVGDLMCHMPQANNAKKDDGSYDFTGSFTYVKKYLSEADITIGNLETTLAGKDKPYSGYPAFNSPDEYITAVKDAGFDFLVTANNHSMDTGEDGIQRTISVIKQNGLPYAGTYTSQADHDSVRILTVRGVKVAILNYTYGTNGSYPKSDHKYMLNVIDSTAITNEVKKAKQHGSDVVLVFYHFGIENHAEPVQAQKDAVRYAWQAGANLVIGAHPHVVGPVKYIEPYPGNRDSVFIAYSLGNFISNQKWRYTDAGVILNLKVQKNHTQNKVVVSKADIMPTWVYRGENAKLKRHIVFPAQLYEQPDFLPEEISDSMKYKMKEAFEDTKAIINKYGIYVDVKPL